MSTPQSQTGFNVSLKLSLNTCFCKWFRPRRRLVTNFYTNDIWMLFNDGLIILRMLTLSYKLYLVSKRGTVSIFLVIYDEILHEIVLYGNPYDLSFGILNKEHGFLNHRLFSRDSKPNSWYSFSFEVPRITPIIARQAYVSFLIPGEMMHCIVDVVIKPIAII